MFTNYTHLIMFIFGGLFNLMKYMYKVVFPVNDILHCSIWEMSVHRLSFIGCVRAVYSKTSQIHVVKKWPFNAVQAW